MNAVAYDSGEPVDLCVQFAGTEFVRVAIEWINSPPSVWAED